jgi:hypothetical protein
MSYIWYICTVVSEKFAASAIRIVLPCSRQALVEGITSEVFSHTVTAVTILITV